MLQLTAAQVQLIGPGHQAVTLEARAADPAVQRVHPGHQLRHRKGLGHIVIGTGHQTGDPVALLPHGGEHDDADLAAHAPDAAAYVKAADIRQHHVQHGDGHIVVVPKISCRLLAQGELHGLVTGPVQIDDHKGADVVLVLQNQNFLVHLILLRMPAGLDGVEQALQLVAGKRQGGRRGLRDAEAVDARRVAGQRLQSPLHGGGFLPSAAGKHP